jgi:hypothetical protein
MAVGADTWGVEAVPPVQGDRVFYGHVEFLISRKMASISSKP